MQTPIIFYFNNKNAQLASSSRAFKKCSSYFYLFLSYAHQIALGAPPRWLILQLLHCKLVLLVSNLQFMVSVFATYDVRFATYGVPHTNISFIIYPDALPTFGFAAIQASQTSIHFNHGLGVTLSTECCAGWKVAIV